MYTPAAFREARPEMLQAVIAAHPLATFVTAGSHGLDVTHLPLLYFPDGSGGVLRGHMARANSQWCNYLPHTEALAIFHGPQHYITPAWYASKKEHGKVVPTWNYVVVHARGKLTFTSDAQWLLDNVRALTESQERTNSTPWRVEDAPADFIQNTLNAIVGVEMKIDTLEGKWKVSQNRSATDREGVIAGLKDLNSPEALRMAGVVAATLTVG